MKPTRAATTWVRGLARDALRAESGLPVEASGRDQSDAPDIGDLATAVIRQRVVELVHTHADPLRLPGDLAAGLARIRSDARARVPLQLLELSRLRSLLDADGVRFLVFKGPALSLQTTGDLGARGFGDLDVLVEPAAVEAVTGRLLASGWTARTALPPPGSWAWKRIVHAAHELSFVGSSCSVDLHWRLDPTLDALPAFEDLWARRSELDLGGGTVPAVGVGDALSHACLNAAKDEWRWLRNLVDVHRLARLEHAWDDFAPGRLQVHALAITDAQVGLPAATPAAVRDRIDCLRSRTRRRLVAVAEQAQELPVRTLQEGPGTATAQFIRYQLGASASPRDLRRTLGNLVLPAGSLGAVDAPSAWTGVPVGLGHRVGGLARRTLERSDRAGGGR